MKTPIKILFIFLVILAVGIGGYFGYRFLTQRQIRAGDSGGTGSHEEMIYGHTKTDFLGVVNGYRSRLGNPPVDMSELYAIKEMNDKEWKKVAKMTGYKSVKELKRKTGYGEGFMGKTMKGNINSGYYIFEDVNTGKLRLYCRAFKRKVL